jgi:hypothetical protein
MLPAPLVAVMIGRRPVIHPNAPPAGAAAPAQLRIQVEYLGVNAPDLQLPECRPDVPDVALVGPAFGVLDAEDVQVAVHQLADRCPGPGVPVLVHLVQQVGADPLGHRRARRELTRS